MEVRRHLGSRARKDAGLYRVGPGRLCQRGPCSLGCQGDGRRPNHRLDQLPRHHTGDPSRGDRHTWYSRSWQRTFVNSACKLRLLEHAFDTLGCSVVGWRTDNTNFRSQAAIERLGAKKDGVIRRQAVRRDGTLRDTVMYSVTSEEWNAGIRERLLGFLAGEKG